MNPKKKKTIIKRPKRGSVLLTSRQYHGRATIETKRNPLDSEDHRQITATAWFQGPLPPPSMLEHYGDIFPDGAERIVAMAEKEQKHAHQMARWGAYYRFLGLSFGFLALIAITWGAVETAQAGQSWVAVTLVGTLIVSILALIGGHDKIIRIMDRHKNAQDHADQKKQPKN